MEILGKILGNSARVKIMRLFLLNPSASFDNQEVAKRSRVAKNLAMKELRLLAAVGFIKRRNREWYFNTSFKCATEIEDLLINSDSLDKSAILEMFKRTGRIKLLIVSGIFIKSKDSRVDLLIVGDRLQKGRIEDGIRKLEAEIGAELSYTVFDTKEFNYRLDMYDKLVRDILDYPHEILFQDKKLSSNFSKNPRG
jgi:hypothetical protein